MATISIRHEQGFHSTVEARGHRLAVDVPETMGGEDRGPTPIELLAGSLGSCVAVYVARWCQEAKIPYQGFEVEVDYTHDREAHCVPEMTVKVRMPAAFPSERQGALRKVAEACTVHNTLCSLPKIELTIGEPAAASR